MSEKPKFLKKMKLLSPIMLLFAASFANANLITNGDFENGDQDFLTDYTLGIGVTAQRYNITTDPSLNHPSAASYGDHTSGSGLMMAVNGATVPNQLVWGQQVSLTANTDYEFSIWVSSWISSNPAILVFDIGGISLGSVIAPSVNAVWEEYSFSFNSSATSGPAFLSIVDTRLAFGGDDFAIDDISLVEVSEPPPPPPAGVPEPATLMLIGLGLAGIGHRRRKKRSHADPVRRGFFCLQLAQAA